MAALTVTLPLQLLCQLVTTGSPGTATVSGSALNVTVPLTEISNLPDGYVAYPDVGAAYKVYAESVLWKVARRRCISEGANLALIDSVKKFDYVSRLDNSGVVSVGIHSLFDDDEWVSVKTGLPLSTIPWGPGEPNGPYHCAMIRPDKSGLGNFDCKTAMGHFVCEIPIPENFRPEETTVLHAPVAH